MFKIYADGHILYEPLNDELIISDPQLTLEMGKAGSLQFVLPPTNRYYDQLHQLKTKVSVEWDGVELFRGRVLSITRNFNNLRTVYCEGDLAYLLDTVQKGERYEGKTHDFFKKIIAQHNERIKDPEKQFTVGNITIENRDILISGESDEIQDAETGKFDYRQIAINAMSGEWKPTMDYIEDNLIEYTGGYLRTRRQNGVTYIDLVMDYGNKAAQNIEFGKNMLDLTEEISAEDSFTVLIPLGDEGLTIATVNDGSDELVDEAGVERFGRIVKSHVFDSVTKPETLFENAQRFLANHENAPITLTVEAVDMHFVDADATPIYVGDKIRVNSAPHGMKDELTCTKIEYDLEDPTNNTYTFGTPKQTMTERYRKDQAKQSSSSKSNAAHASGGGGGAGGISNFLEQNTEDQLQSFYDAWINVDESLGHIDLGTLYKNVNQNRTDFDMKSSEWDASIELHTETLDKLGDSMSKAETNITMLTNQNKAQIELNAKYGDRISAVEILASKNESSINLHTETLDTLSDSMSKAETNITMLTNQNEAQIELNAAYDKKIATISATADKNESAIKLKADKVYVENEIEAVKGSFNTVITDRLGATSGTIRIIRCQKIYVTGPAYAAINGMTGQLATMTWVQQHFVKK